MYDTRRDSPVTAAHDRGERSVVLIADDLDVNRELLRSILEAEGHDVMEANDGEEAVAIATRELPDAVLLDVRMPGVDGIEACRRLKTDDRTKTIPILMITANHDRENRMRGIASGATDFLEKPVDDVELRLRVHNAVSTSRLFAALGTANRQLEREEALRNEMTHMLVHDLRQPIQALTLYSDHLVASLPDSGFKPTLVKMQGIVGRIRVMLHAILDANKMEATGIELTREPLQLGELLRSVAAELAPMLHGRRVEIDADDAGATVDADREMIRRVVSNLLVNAVEHTPKGTAISLGTALESDGVSVHVVDNGPGVPPEHQRMIFDKYGQVSLAASGRTYSPGLGLAFCRLAIEAHGGVIGVDSRVGTGSTFWFRLPRTSYSHGG